MKILLLGVFGLVAVPVLANGSAAAAAIDDADNIVVTAQKRAETINDVPLTVTAYTGQMLQSIGVTQLDQLSMFVPGLNIQEQSPADAGFVIRGITSDSGSSQDSPRVTVYYNGIDVSRSRGSYFDLFDIERVEVVKGPQPSLFGTASTIGAISVLSARPTGELGGEVRAAYGNYNNLKLSGVINTGGDKVSARLAFAYKRRDGYVKDIAGDAGSQTPGGTKVDDLNGQGQTGVRASVRLRPTETLTIDLIATYDGQRAPGVAFKSGRLAPTGGNTSPYSYAEDAGSPVGAAVLGGDQPHLKRDVYDFNTTVTYDPEGPFSFTSVTGYRQFHSHEIFDADGSQAWLFEAAEDSRGRQVSHEDRIAYDSDKFHGFAGINIFHETGSQRTPFSTEEGSFIQCITGIIPGLPCIAANGVVTAAQATSILTHGQATVLPYSSQYRNSANLTTYSAFFDATYLPVPRVELTLGGRMIYEDRISGYSAIEPNSVLTGAPLLPFVDTQGQTFKASGHFTAFLPRANMLFRLSDKVNLYATVSKGRRSPVLELTSQTINGAPAPSLNDIPAETVWNYETGIKGRRGVFSFSLAGFYETYRNFQVTVIDNGMQVSRNAGSARNYGAEGEVSARLGKFLTLFANSGYIDARVDDKPSNGIFAGNRFRLQSKWQAAGGATATLPLRRDLEAFATPTVTFRSKLFFEMPNSELLSQGAVMLINLRAGIRAPDGRWELLGYATNLANHKYLLDAGNTGASFGYPTFIPAQPRFFGVEGAVRF